MLLLPRVQTGHNTVLGLFDIILVSLLLTPSPLLLVRSSSFDVLAASSPLHHLHLGAVRADDVLAVGDEAAADQRSLAARADETIVVPMPVLEGDEAGAANA